MQIEAETRRSPSLDDEELRHFERLAQKWWDERGKFRGLHAFNPARISFIVEEVRRWRGGDMEGFRPFEGLSILDIGCGGGILSEPLARLGGCVTGIDPVAESIGVATAHAQKQNLSIAYKAITAEELARDGQCFDVVVASEVVEHVANLALFLETCRALCKPRGLLIVSTLNRTAKSFALAIVAAERVLGLIPRGTHDRKKFIKPEELNVALKIAKFDVVRTSGIVLKPSTGTWGLSETDVAINYITSAETK